MEIIPQLPTPYTQKKTKTFLVALSRKRYLVTGCFESQWWWGVVLGGGFESKWRGGPGPAGRTPSRLMAAVHPPPLGGSSGYVFVGVGADYVSPPRHSAGSSPGIIMAVRGEGSSLFPCSSLSYRQQMFLEQEITINI